MGNWKIKHLNTEHFIYLYFWDIQANNDLIIIAIGYLALLWKHFFFGRKSSYNHKTNKSRISNDGQNPFELLNDKFVNAFYFSQKL